MQGRFLAILTFAAAAGLSACGGGGVSPNPIPSTSNPPAASYSVSLRVTGMMNSSTLQSDLRRTMTASNEPIMLAAPLTANPGPGESVGIGNVDTVQAVVSPAPSVTPSAAFSTTSAVATIQPTPTPPAGASPVPDAVYISDLTPGTKECNATVSAQIGNPVNTTATRGLCIYPQWLLETGTQPSPSYASVGLTLQNGSVVQSSAGDIYLDGQGNVVLPGGAVSFDGDTAFNTLASTQWTNAATSYSLNAIATTRTGDGASQIAQWLFKGADGETAKAFALFVAPGNSGNAQLEIVVQVAGHAVDGFN